MLSLNHRGWPRQWAEPAPLFISTGRLFGRGSTPAAPPSVARRGCCVRRVTAALTFLFAVPLALAPPFLSPRNLLVGSWLHLHGWPFFKSDNPAGKTNQNTVAERRPRPYAPVYPHDRLCPEWPPGPCVYLCAPTRSHLCRRESSSKWAPPPRAIHQAQ